jgi:dynamin 1-like protein
MVKNLVVVQDAYINTYHPDFMGGANSVFNMFDQEKANEAKGQNQKTPGRLNVESMDDGAVKPDDQLVTDFNSQIKFGN